MIKKYINNNPFKVYHQQEKNKDQDNRNYFNSNQ